MNIKQNSLVAVADGETAALFQNTSSSEIKLKSLGDMELSYLDDKGPSTLPEEVTDKEIEEATFAKHIASDLYKRAQKGDFDQLVLIADPQTLGQIRPKLHHEVKQRLVCQIAKTLTNSPTEDIEKAIEKAED